MDTRIIPYLLDHKHHTDLGNEIGQMEIELAAFEVEVDQYREVKTPEWYKKQREIINDRKRRLAVFRKTYEYLDGVNHDALELRRTITSTCKTLRDRVMNGNKFPDTLTQDQHKAMGEILKNLATIYTENKEIQDKTNHTIEL